MPLPILVRAPVVTVLAPLIVRLAAASVTLTEPVVPALKMKFRSVDAVPPVYCSVPAPSTRLAARFVDWPMLLATPPLAKEFALNTPALIVVAPV